MKKIKYKIHVELYEKVYESEEQKISSPQYYEIGKMIDQQLLEFETSSEEIEDIERDLNNESPAGNYMYNIMSVKTI